MEEKLNFLIFCSPTFAFNVLALYQQKKENTVLTRAAVGILFYLIDILFVATNDF